MAVGVLNKEERVSELQRSVFPGRKGDKEKSAAPPASDDFHLGAKKSSWQQLVVIAWRLSSDGNQVLNPQLKAHFHL